MKKSKVTVCIVTWNSEKYIEKCVENIMRQTTVFDLLIIDNNSSDNTQELIKKLQTKFKIKAIFLKDNSGFCGGHNLGISKTKSEYYMPLNPDIFPNKNYIEELVIKLDKFPKIGSATGKLLRINPDTYEKTKIIDSKGIYFKSNMRALDIGSDTIDEYPEDNKSKLVFGASGAAPLYRRKMINDISIDNEFFLQDFFAYREDVDVAWRAQLRMWDCLFLPTALAYHVRHNTPEKRDQMSEFINMHSVKNRMLMLLQNLSNKEIMKFGYNFLYYDLLIYFYVLIKEKTSLPAFTYILKNRKKIRNRKKIIQNSRLRGINELSSWFGNQIYLEFEEKI